MSYRAVVVGATGAVGSALVRELLRSPACAGVVALTRRPADNLALSDGLRVHVIDLGQLETATREIGRASCRERV